MSDLVSFCSCVFSPFGIPITSLGEERARMLILVLFVRLFDLYLFVFVGFLFLLVSGKAAVCNCGTPWTFLLPVLLFLFVLLTVLKRWSRC